MSSTKRVETSKICCECGKGEFLFYACEADRWPYLEDHETWFEMHILCDSCSRLFVRYKLSVSSENDNETHWKLNIPEADHVPCHL